MRFENFKTNESGDKINFDDLVSISGKISEMDSPFTQSLLTSVKTNMMALIGLIAIDIERTTGKSVKFNLLNNMKKIKKFKIEFDYENDIFKVDVIGKVFFKLPEKKGPKKIRNSKK